MIGRLFLLELVREARARAVVGPLVLLAGLVVAVSDLALHDVDARPQVVAATLWIGLTFAAALALGRGTVADVGGGLDALLVVPASRAAVFAASAAANAVLLGVVAAVLGPLQAVLAGDEFGAGALLAAPVVLLGVVGLAAAGTLLAAVAGRTRAREGLLPILLLPILAPLLVAATHGTADALAGGGWDDVRAEVTLLAGYDLALLAVSALLFEHAVEG